MPRQLNVRSDEAHALAHRIAARRGLTASRVVVDALRAYAGEGEGERGATARGLPDADGLTVPRSPDITDAEIAEGMAQMKAAIRSIWGGAPPGTPSTAEADMYDEDGLPK
jgi:Rv0623-like transcription factor